MNSATPTLHTITIHLDRTPHLEEADFGPHYRELEAGLAMLCEMSADRLLLAAHMGHMSSDVFSVAAEGAIIAAGQSGRIDDTMLLAVLADYVVRVACGRTLPADAPVDWIADGVVPALLPVISALLIGPDLVRDIHHGFVNATWGLLVGGDLFDLFDDEEEGALEDEEDFVLPNRAESRYN